MCLKRNKGNYNQERNETWFILLKEFPRCPYYLAHIDIVVLYFACTSNTCMQFIQTAYCLHIEILCCSVLHAHITRACPSQRVHIIVFTYKQCAALLSVHIKHMHVVHRECITSTPYSRPRSHYIQHSIGWIMNPTQKQRIIVSTSPHCHCTICDSEWYAHVRWFNNTTQENLLQ